MSVATRVTERLEQIWSDPPGVPGFFSTVDHKRIGIRYLWTGFAFFLIAGVQALLMRTQLAVPDNTIVGPEEFNRLFTMHGTTMIFLFNTPILAGFGNYFVPLMIGTRDMAFPKMNAFSYWVYLLSSIFLYGSFLSGQVPDTGWFAYPPLSSSQAFSPGRGLDFWTLGVVFLGLSTTVGGFNFIVTIFKMRAPGMTLSRMPLFVWAILVMAFLILFSLPAITLGPLLMEFDRAFGTAFFDATRGGDPLLYQHLFWFWGHPEVYILFVPAIGMLAMIIPTFARRPQAGYTWVVASLLAIGFISFGVWVHHMFATGIPDLTNSFFSAAGLVITIPSAIEIFAWIATLWTGRIRWGTPLLFALGFLSIFVLGGITGVMVSMVPFDWQATDSYFVVAHLHYVLIGGVVFPVFAAFYYWLPKITGYLMDERLGGTSFWIMLIGFHLTFFPMHIVGLMGMPRRVYTFHDGLGWGVYNRIETIGGFMFALGVLISVAAFVLSFVKRVPAGDNPWNAGTLEWATTSPPADYNFAAMPAVRSRYPLWEPDAPHPTAPKPGDVVLAPAGIEEHATLGTAGLDARVEDILVMPHPTAWPFLLAFGLFVGFSAMLLRSAPLGVLGLIWTVVAMIGWHWNELRGAGGHAASAEGGDHHGGGH